MDTVDFLPLGIYKNNQLIDYNSRPDVHTPADTVCIYFDNPSWFSPKKIEKGFAFATEEAEKRKNNSKTYCLCNQFS